ARILAPTLIQVINRGRDQGVPDCLISCHSGCSASPQLKAERKKKNLPLEMMRDEGVVGRMKSAITCRGMN
ncbi:Phosphomethylpyrimidine synthase, partial [Clarias magur]